MCASYVSASQLSLCVQAHTHTYTRAHAHTHTHTHTHLYEVDSYACPFSYTNGSVTQGHRAKLHVHKVYLSVVISLSSSLIEMTRVKTSHDQI